MTAPAVSEATLDADAFGEYFVFVHGYQPYPWQTRLAGQVLASGEFPSVIDLPTGSGKTAVVDVALFVLAARPDVFPRRVVFVVDRRIIVDSALTRAELIRDRLAKSTSSDGVPYEVRCRLLALWGEPPDSVKPPLEVAALRGGIPRTKEWADWPDRAAIITSTVDQFGSQLLMRGYGVSPGMKPIYAGLAGNDGLVILDEVHISRAFATTLEDVTSSGKFPGINAWSDLLPTRRFQIVKMSATPVLSDEESRFQLAPDDTAQSGYLRSILEPHKRIECVEGELMEGKEHEQMPKEVTVLLNPQMLNVVERNGTVGVIVNRVRTARAVHQALDEDNRYESYLVTGRMRPLDRADVVDSVKKVANPDRPKPSDDRLHERLRVVVATQAIEVGADLSFDLLITECAPVDSLKQRLGRLDRRGKVGTAVQPTRCLVVGHAAEEDHIYGIALKETWDVLAPKTKDDRLREAGPDSQLWKAFSVEDGDRVDEKYCAPYLTPPVLLPTHVEAWVQTNPEPDAQSEPDWFLHGFDPKHPAKRLREVDIVWRWDASEDGLRMMPVRAAERLTVPYGEARRWLSGLAEDGATDADVPRLSPDELDDAPLTPEQQFYASTYRRRRGKPEVRVLGKPADLEPGDTLIVSPEVGGIVDGNWHPRHDGEDPQPVADLGSRAQFESGYKLVLSLHPAMDYIHAPPQPNAHGEITDDDRDVVREWLRTVHDAIDAADKENEWLRSACKTLLDGAHELLVVEPGDNSSSYFVVRARGAAADTDTDDARSMTGLGTLLDDHLKGVGDHVEAMARRLGCSDEIVADLRLAAEIHDMGKVDPRFQRRMRGPGAMEAEVIEGEPLAKSLPGAGNIPTKEPRHEINSVLLAQSNDDLLAAAHDRDLVLHLVATHHGYARPMPLPSNCEPNDPQKMCYEAKTSEGRFSLCADAQNADDAMRFEACDRFWRVYERYGHHGMVWLEAILRLADHRQSEREKQA